MERSRQCLFSPLRAYRVPQWRNLHGPIGWLNQNGGDQFGFRRGGRLASSSARRDGGATVSPAVKPSAAYQAGSIALTGKNEATEVTYGIPAFRRIMSALVPTTLEVAKSILAKVKASNGGQRAVNRNAISRLALPLVVSNLNVEAHSGSGHELCDA